MRRIQVLPTHHARAGFTLIELMIALVIILILTIIAVVAYTRVMARARVTEVYAMFADIRAKEESYRAEFGQYLTISASEGAVYPALIAGSEPRRKPWAPAAGSPWLTLGIRPTSPQVYCGYAVMAGPPGTSPGGGTYMLGMLGGVPPVWWWAATAMCDNDNRAGDIYSGQNHVFITSSQSTFIRELNEGR